jgi:hypothetical protein
MDIVAPKGNERELIAMAERLGWTALTLAYFPKDLPRELPAARLELRKAVIIPAQDVQRWRGKAFTIVFAERGRERQAIEAGPDMVVGLEETQPRDTLHERRSGLNQVLAAIAHRKGVRIGIAFSRLLDARGTDRARLLGRVSQNILICRKAKARVVLASAACLPERMRSPHDLMALGRMLGMTPREAQDALAP